MLSLVFLTSLLQLVTCNHLFGPSMRMIDGAPNLDISSDPEPCRANVMSNQANYICAQGKIWCLPGWKNPDNFCRDPDCPEGCEKEKGECHEPNVCHCKVGYHGHTCSKCIPLPGCQHGDCKKAYECICQPGWQGIYCDRAICKEGCDQERGFCDFPGECKCHLGWRGPNCTECAPLPGCMNGSCKNPMECICNKGWQGSVCEQPVCDAACVPPRGTCQKPDFCICQLGYSGKNCDTCRTYPGCVNGVCSRTADGHLKPWTCECTKGFTGLLCDEKL